MRKYLLFAIMFFALTTYVNAQTFSGTTGSITDNYAPNWNTFTTTATGLATSTSSSFGLEYVTINVTHTYDGDLNFELASPNGTRIHLSSDNGGSGNNYQTTVFRMDAASSITAGSAPFNGSYIPEGDLDLFRDGQNPNGTWTLYVQDDSNTDIGTVDSWSITFYLEQPCMTDCSDATNIASLPYSLSGQTTCDDCVAFTSADACGSEFMDGQDEVYAYTPSSDGWIDVQITTAENAGGNERAAAVFLLDACPSSGGATCMASSTVQYPDFHGSPHIVAELTAGVTYYIIVSNGPGVHNADPCINYDIAVTNISQPTPTTQDCFNAIPLCFASYTENNAFVNSGNYPSEINSATSCLEGERNDVWYTFTVQTSGTVEFTIVPAVSGDDYDWAVYNITGETCSDVFSDPAAEVSCNYSMTAGDTGPDGSTTQTSGGVYDYPFNAALNVIAGETYVVNVSQWTVSTNGYSITFGGTAQVVDNVGASLVGITNSPACGEDVITVEISENVLCSSVEPSDWIVTGPGGTYSITNVSSSICDAGGSYDKFFDLTLNTALIAGGTYNLDLDGQINDLCSHTTVSTDIDFIVTGISGSVDSYNDVTCPSGNDGDAAVSATGGSPAYTYIWDNTAGSTTPSVSGLPAGTYHVTISDQVGVCKDIQTIIISQPDPIIVSFNTTDVQCNGDNDGIATATPSGGNGAAWSYTWSAGGATSSATNTGLLPGITYTVTVSDNQSCTQIDSISVSEPSLPLTSTVNTLHASCHGFNGSINLTPIGGTTPYTYVWSNSETTQNISTGVGTYNVTITDANLCQFNTSGTINEPDTISVITVINDPNCGNTDGDATVTPSGGVGSYTYSWASSPYISDTTSNFTDNLLAGSYVVTVYDGNNCEFVQSVNLSDVGAATIDVINILNNQCFNDSLGSAEASIISGGTGPFTYTWTIGGDTIQSSGVNTVDNIPAGIYSVAIDDINNCISTLGFTIEENPQFNVTTQIDIEILCFGDSNAVVSITPLGGTVPYTYLWNHDVTLLDSIAPYLGSGTYTVTVTDDSLCTKIEHITINDPSLLTVGLDTSINVSCFGGNDAEISIMPIGGTPNYNYSWENGDSAPTTDSLYTGYHTVTLTDANNCFVVDSFQVFEPTQITVLSLNSINSVCGGSTGALTINTTGGTGSYFYEWEHDTLITINTATNISQGTYLISVIDSMGCVLDTSGTIIDDAAGIASIPSTSDVLCFGGATGTATINMEGGTPGFTYIISMAGVNIESTQSSNTSYDISNLVIGIYDIEVIDTNGCISTTNITINQPTELIPSLDNLIDLSCNNDSTGSISVSASGGTPSYSYLWSNGEANANITGINSGTYTVTISDNNLCYDTLIISINEPSLMAISESIYYENHYGAISVIATGGTPDYTYEWSNGETNNIINNLFSGDYWVTITDANGCAFTNLYNIEVELVVPSVITPNADGKNDFFRITNINAFEQADIKIFNRWGDIIFTYDGTGIGYEDPEKQWDGTYNGLELPMGSYVYIINLKNDKDPYTGTVTIVR